MTGNGRSGRHALRAWVGEASPPGVRCAARRVRQRGEGRSRGLGGQLRGLRLGRVNPVRRYALSAPAWGRRGCASGAGERAPRGSGPCAPCWVRSAG